MSRTQGVAHSRLQRGFGSANLSHSMEPLACKLGRWVPLCLALSFSAAPALRADVTVRYQTGMKSAAPPSPGMDLSSTVHIKGNKASTTTGGLTMIIDARSEEHTSELQS